MIETIPLRPGVTLRCLQDTRFKQGCLSIQFLRAMTAREASLNALLPAVLLRGTRSAPDLRSITQRLDDLYGASVGELVRRAGNLQTTGFYSSFIDDRFALEGDAVLKPMVNFLRQLLLEPVLEEGCFREDYVESEKKNLISALEARKNDKRAYASSQLLKFMCREDSFGIPRLGEPEQAAAITRQSLYAHYRKVLKESPVHLFYVGAAAPEEIAELLRPLAAGLAEKQQQLPPQTPFTPGEVSRHTEIMDIAQGKLRLGYTTPVTNRHPLFAAMQVANAMLGGGMTSKLFTEVREKQSLCYDIASGYYGSKGILIISAGIDADQEDRVCWEIGKQLDAICVGDFTPEELASAREGILTQLEAVNDTPGAIENYYESAALNGLMRLPKEYRREIAGVTPEQVAQAARTLKRNTTYFLRGALE